MRALCSDTNLSLIAQKNVKNHQIRTQNLAVQRKVAAAVAVVAAQVKVESGQEGSKYLLAGTYLMLFVNKITFVRERRKI